MDLFKQLESALHTTAASVVEGNLLTEFPSGRAPTGPSRAPLSAAANAAVATSAVEAWASFGLDGRRDELRSTLEQLQQPAGPSARQKALAKLVEQVVSFIALPDPTQALEGAAAAAKRSVELEGEVRQLQRELKAAHADDVEVQQLVAAHEKEKAANTRLRAELESTQAELASLKTEAGSSIESEAKLAAKTEQVEQLQAVLAKLRADYDASQTQLFDALAQREEASGGAHSSEDVAAMDELDRLRRHVVGLRTQRDALQQQVEQLAAAQQLWVQLEQEQQQVDDQRQEHLQEQNGMLSPRSAVLGAARDAERLQARAELEGALARLHEAEHQNRLLESRLHIAEAQAGRLQTEVNRRPTVEQHAELVASVSALSALLGRQLEQEGWESGTAQAAVAAVTADPGQLPSQLQERVKKLAEALATASREAEGFKAERDAALQAVEATERQLAEARSTVHQLETDLVVAAASSRLGGSSSLGQMQSLQLPDAEPSCIAEGALTTACEAAISGAGGADGASAGNLLAVVVRQRDRFASRISSLEEQCSSLQARITELSTSNQKLTADNVSLVEKLRYLKQRQLTGGGGAAGMGGGGATVIRVDSAGVQEQENKAARYSCGPLAFEVAGRRRRQQMGRMEAIADMGGPEARYAHQYERAINPFADFQKAEVEGRVRNLKLHDRVMFATGSLIAGSSLARAALFLYLVLLHMFVMVVTYRNASPQCFVASGG